MIQNILTGQSDRTKKGRQILFSIHSSETLSGIGYAVFTGMDLS